MHIFFAIVGRMALGVLTTLAWYLAERYIDEFVDWTMQSLRSRRNLQVTV